MEAKPKYKIGDTLVYGGYLYDKPTELELEVVEIAQDRCGEFIYYDAGGDDCFEHEVIRVK